MEHIYCSRPKISGKAALTTSFHTQPSILKFLFQYKVEVKNVFYGVRLPALPAF